VRLAYVMINSEINADGVALCLHFAADIRKIRRYKELREHIRGALEEAEE
jgi:hypothetical protein